MPRFLLMLVAAFTFTACHHVAASHRYLHDKHNSSEEIAAGQKKASKAADKDFHKTLKKNKKDNIKKGNRWGKKKKQYTNVMPAPGTVVAFANADQLFERF